MPLALLPRPGSTKSAIPPPKETDLDRILKLIPTEILAFYTAVMPITPEVPWRYFSFALFLVCLGLVPLVLYLDGQNTGAKARWSQYVIRTLAFVAWAIAISWPFSAWSNGEDFNWLRSLAVLVVPLVGALLLPRTGTTAA